MNYNEFLHTKVEVAPVSGFEVRPEDIHPSLKPHQRDAVMWAVKGGRRALFESFGLGKTVQELEWCRLVQEHEQRQLLDEMGRTDATPNLSQSQRLRIFSRDGRLSPDVICAIMSEEKANQKERLRIPVDRVKKFFPKSYTTARMEEEIIKLCEAQYRRRMSREAR